MVTKKEGFRIFFLFLFIILFSNSVFALSVSPAKIELNFQPDYKNTFKYQVGGVGADRIVGISVEGDLKEYITLDKNNLKGGGGFNVNLDFPENIEKPGKHRILIVVSEKPDEEVRNMIGTAIVLKVAIDIFVPYPGRYLEITKFESNNANVGDNVVFELCLANKGRENLTANPRIEINSKNKNIETLLMKSRAIGKNQDISLEKILNTSLYSPGKYNASAIIDYGILISKEIMFRIGDLIIYINDYDKEVNLNDKLEKFNIEVENGWNDKIDGVYAEILFFNNSKKITEIRTSTESLKPFEIGNINGYIDTSKFIEGVYDANITLYYFGRDKGASSSEFVKIKFIKQEKNLVYLVFIGVVLLIILLVIFLFLKKRFKNRK